jgi:hypothetical protein
MLCSLACCWYRAHQALRQKRDVYKYVSCGRLRLYCGWRHGPASLLAPAASGSVRCVKEMCQGQNLSGARGALLFDSREVPLRDLHSRRRVQGHADAALPALRSEAAPACFRMASTGSALTGRRRLVLRRRGDTAVF